MPLKTKCFSVSRPVLVSILNWDAFPGPTMYVSDVWQQPQREVRVPFHGGLSFQRILLPLHFLLSKFWKYFSLFGVPEEAWVLDPLHSWPWLHFLHTERILRYPKSLLPLKRMPSIPLLGWDAHPGHQSNEEMNLSNTQTNTSMKGKEGVSAKLDGKVL